MPRSALASIIKNCKGIKLKELTSTKLTFISKEFSDPLAGEGPAEASAGPHPRRGAAAAGLERGGRRGRGRGRRFSARSVRGGGRAGGGRAAGYGYGYRFLHASLATSAQIFLETFRNLDNNLLSFVMSTLIFSKSIEFNKILRKSAEILMNICKTCRTRQS